MLLGLVITSSHKLKLEFFVQEELKPQLRYTTQIRGFHPEMFDKTGEKKIY